MRSTFIIGIVIAAIVAIGVYFFLITPTPTPEATASPSSNTSNEITVTASNYKFNPAEIKAKKGDMVKITFKDDMGNHDLQLPDFKVGTKVLNAGQEETIEFLADKTGTFEYFCSVGNHRAMGMKGNLIIE